MEHTHRDTWWGGLAHKSTGMFGYWMLEIVNCIRGGFNGTNPRGSTPQSAETAEICGTNLWQFLIVLLEKIDKFAKHTQQISFKLVSYFQQCLFSLLKFSSLLLESL